MNQFYQNVNTLKDKIQAIDNEILDIQKRIKQIDSWSGLPVNQVLLGDCLDLMKTLPDNCVDCVVTDPPYSLGKIKSVSALLQSWLNGEDGYEHHSNGFMSKKWDILPSPNVWREVLRVLKPGGYALVFAGTRTYDLMGMSLRLAGFEIQDSIAWMQGQGFPKGKTQLKPSNEPILMAYKPGARILNIDDCRIGIDLNDKNLRFNNTNHKGTLTLYQGGFKNPITYPHSVPDKGRHPSNVILSHNPDCVCNRTKQIKGANHIGSVKNEYNRPSNNFIYGGGKTKVSTHVNPNGTETIAAYTCSDGCPVKLLDEQTAEMRASQSSRVPLDYFKKNEAKDGVFKNVKTVGKLIPSYKDGDSTANASRFFLNLEPEAPFIYQPKASKNDRTINGKVENTHVTVKPQNLMAYLVRLVCPPEGIVLDPFLGSGSTAIGCLKEQRYYIGMEQNEEYHKIALERIQAYQNQ